MPRNRKTFLSRSRSISRSRSRSYNRGFKKSPSPEEIKKELPDFEPSGLLNHYSSN